LAVGCIVGGGVGALVTSSDDIGFNVSLCTGADVGAFVSFGFGHCIFSKHTVPDGHIRSSALHVCNAYEHDDMTSDKLDEQ